MSFLRKAKYGATNKATYVVLWASYFDGVGKNSPFQLEAFLAYWLSYFVFPGPPEDGLHNFVFPWRCCSPRGKGWFWCHFLGLFVCPN